MKFNKWTIGLAAVGVVSMASVASAEEKMNAVQTALSSTTISGYVDTSAQWNPGTGNMNVPAYKFNSPSKADGFNLDVVDIKIAKPLDEGQWSAGYNVDLLYGPDANVYGTSSTGINTSDFAIRQAYVSLRAPVGNGLDFKMGVFDSIIGYESFESGNDPNYTRSYGNTIEPQTHTGVLATYRFCDWFAASAGVADTVGPTIDQRNFVVTGYGVGSAESYKTYMGSIALTAPDSMGFLAGSSLYAGVVNGFKANVVGPLIGAANQTSWYAGATLKTPVTGLVVGLAYDYLGVSSQPLTGAVNGAAGQSAYANSIAGYLSYQATEKLSFHLREEYFTMTGQFPDPTGLGNSIGVAGLPTRVLATTATIQYDLWQNVISRLEFRWDHQADGTGYAYGATTTPTASNPLGGTRRNAYMMALNVIYKF